MVQEITKGDLKDIITFVIIHFALWQALFLIILMTAVGKLKQFWSWNKRIQAWSIQIDFSCNGVKIDIQISDIHWAEYIPRSRPFKIH